ncbi:MAG: B12-binding domain-containing radical SAM protein [Desulfomonile sp.]|nr:B12-binding domain-containing radical SAM protein [Desulfomonile sp.]
MGLLVLGTLLRKLGWEPLLVDCLDPDHPAEPSLRRRSYAQGRFRRTPIPKPEVLAEVPRTFSRYGVSPAFIRRDLMAIPGPAAILVTGLMTYWYTGVQETILLLRECFPQVPVILGGVYATLMPEHAAKWSGADEVVRGPGEANLADVLYRLTGRRLGQCDPRSPLECVPALDLMRKVRFLPLLTSRGCPFRCTYCASHQLVGGFMRLEPAAVLREIEVAVQRYDVRDVALYDDAFLIDAKRYAIPLLKSAGERFPQLRWHSPNGLHAAAITSEVAAVMKNAGFETIRIGLESSSNEFHAATGAKTSRTAFENAVRNLINAGFSWRQIGAYLLVGLPGQSQQRIEEDVEFVLRCGGFPKLAEYSPIPGTRLWSRALETSRFAIDREPLFHNCTLLPAASPSVDWSFLQGLRSRIATHMAPEQ